MKDEISKEDVLRNCVLCDKDTETIRYHKNRVIRNAKENRVSQVSHLFASLIEGSISFKEFLQRQHNERLFDCLGKFLFRDADLFGDVYRRIEKESTSFDEAKVQSDVRHEEEHRRKASNHSVESLFGIHFSLTKKGCGRWEGQTTPTLVAFVEEQAIKAEWNLKKYIEVVEDILDITCMSTGDKKTLETMEALKRLKQ